MAHSLERECELENLAIQQRVALSPWLIDMLDGAAMTGRLPSQREMQPHVAAHDQEEYQPSLWDGRIDGEDVDFAESMRWCTLRQFYGWGFPCAEALEAISHACEATGRLIDFGAGTGYWSAVLRARGIQVIAVDKRVISGHWSRRWTDIREGDGLPVIRESPGVPILISWADCQLDGKPIVEAMEPGRLLLRCGPRAVTSKSLAALLPTHFDLMTSSPVMCAAGNNDDRLEVLVRRETARESQDSGSVRTEMPFRKS